MKRTIVGLLCVLCVSVCASTAQQSRIIGLKEQLVLEPNNAALLYELGMAYDDQGNYAESAIAFDKVAELDPEHVDALYQAGTSYALDGDLSAAIERFRRQLAIREDELAHVTLGGLYSLLGYFDMADSEFAAAGSIASGPVLDSYVSLLRWRQHRTSEARAMLQSSQEIVLPESSPENPAEEWAPFRIWKDPDIEYLDMLVSLAEKAEKIAGRSFEVPPPFPESDLETRVAFLEQVWKPRQRFCRVAENDSEWDFVIALLAAYPYPDGDGIQELTTEGVYLPGRDALREEPKHFSRVIVEGWPPCWCEWHDCSKRE